jgi:hypothetical protein
MLLFDYMGISERGQFELKYSNVVQEGNGAL